MKAWKPTAERSECVRYYGNMANLAGLKRYTFADGKAAGVEAVDVDTGAGFNFTVLPGRGMDIAWAKYKGVPVSYMTKAGITNPCYHDRNSSNWIKSFFGGMVTTCGLTNAGPGCECELPVLGPTPFGLHGDISNTAADNVCTCEEWEDGRYVMRVSGRMQEGRLHAEHIQMRREIETALGEKCFIMRDTIENIGDTEQIIMFFYHINIGHPILSEGAKFLAPSVGITPASDVAKAGLEDWRVCQSPTKGYLEQQFFHDMASDENGMTIAALVNDTLEMGAYIRYNVNELPCISQWKVMRDGDYVLAFEPGNCRPEGRESAINRGVAVTLEPLQTIKASLEIGVLDGADEISAVEYEIERLTAHSKR